jgi:hypothetical protein
MKIVPVSNQTYALNYVHANVDPKQSSELCVLTTERGPQSPAVTGAGWECTVLGPVPVPDLVSQNCVYLSSVPCIHYSSTGVLLCSSAIIWGGQSKMKMWSDSFKNYEFQDNSSRIFFSVIVLKNTRNIKCTILTLLVWLVHSHCLQPSPPPSPEHSINHNTSLSPLSPCLPLLLPIPYEPDHHLLPVSISPYSRFLLQVE